MWGHHGYGLHCMAFGSSSRKREVDEIGFVFYPPFLKLVNPVWILVLSPQLESHDTARPFQDALFLSFHGTLISRRAHFKARSFQGTLFSRSAHFKGCSPDCALTPLLVHYSRCSLPCALTTLCVPFHTAHLLSYCGAVLSAKQISKILD